MTTPTRQPSVPTPSSFKRRSSGALVAIGLAVTLSACAIANRGTLQLSRHVTVGQELIDLKRALDEGAITEPEYVTLKAKLFEMADSVEISHGINSFDDDDD